MAVAEFTPEFKHCHACNKTLHHGEFYKSKAYHKGIDAQCKSCKKIRNAARNRTKEIKEKRAEDASFKWKNDAAHRATLLEKQRKHRLSADVRKRQCDLQKSYIKKKPEHYARIAKKSYEKQRLSPEFICAGRIRTGIRRALTGKGKSSRVFDILGYTPKDLSAHIERQFSRGMSWENVGEWHIDHIVPLSSFSIGGWDDPEIRNAWALSNLRPLWAKENMQKRDKHLYLI
jgi:hypothetical protein